MDRRSFLKMAGSGAVIAASGIPAAARGNLEVSDEAVGMLFDATRCIGCRACVASCKEIHGKPAELLDGEPMWDAAEDLSADTLNIIKAYKNEVEGHVSFIKRNCMHCVDPGCVSVCPTKALTKDPVTGIVEYDKDVCIGCRTCMASCPYNIPKYSYDETFGEINKCTFCNSKGIERISKGMLPGCSEVCPTGANIFGKRSDLLEEARRRLELNEGDRYVYKLNAIDSRYQQEGTVGKYQQHIYGEHEAGGTQVLMLAGVPFENLGMPNLPERSYASISETVQHSIYKSAIAPTALLGGMLWLARRNEKRIRDEEDQDGGDS